LLKSGIDESGAIIILNNGLKEICRNGGDYDFQDIDLTNKFTKVLHNIDDVINQLDDFLLNKGFFSRTFHFLYNDIFGTLSHYKSKLTIRFNVDELNMKVNCCNILNWYVYHVIHKLAYL